MYDQLIYLLIAFQAAVPSTNTARAPISSNQEAASLLKQGKPTKPVKDGSQNQHVPSAEMIRFSLLSLPYRSLFLW